MADVDLRQEILQRTLQEVVHEEESMANPCVICLDTVTEPCVAVPCRHANFDFLCLVSWLEQQPNCPLCKSDLTGVQYDLQAPQGPKLYKLPPKSAKPPSTDPTAARVRPDFRRRPRRPPPHARSPQPEDLLLRRRNVYRNQLYSLRVGSNRLSQYRELTPELFNRDEELVSRARKWIRRELRVFSFLNPEPEEEEQPRHLLTRPGPQRLENRRANNAEFLLEYVIAILRTVDIKGSAGQAEELLRDFIGRENSRLFLHELQAWLRSPYTSLEDWDRHVQYPGAAANTPGRLPEAPAGFGRTPASPVRRDRPRSARRTPYRSRSQESAARHRRLQYARDRYIPD
ncbi:hypothetical protein NUU61_000807 [Penicillium alfredii]|uniref:RING-type E3 ubiquitin transferase n=1 Tax=Penicillium alfredii TaxID=1506179 RepID=A0A9W9KRE3_9EURO|nr:uncharacterized protein NUU61_000807 [Penicillium alfredii]KAJ5115048.1 hypothetical protein NUU61_000807 [Penicillium alfredii]